MVHIKACVIICIAMYLCCPVSTHVLPVATANDSESVLAAARLFPTLPIFVSGFANQLCRRDSQLLLDSLRNSTIWAEQMLDASAKSVEGLYVGSFYQMGNFKECIDTETPIQGQYCLATLTLNPPAYVTINPEADIYNPLGSIWDKLEHDKGKKKPHRNVVYTALCVPASCSPSDVEASLSRHLASTPRNHSVRVDVRPELCQNNRKGQPLSAGALAYCAVLGTVLLLVILGTLCDRNTYRPGSEKETNYCGYFDYFSLKKNFYEVCKSSGSRLGCMYGLRVLSTCGIIFGHTLLNNSEIPANNYEHFEKSGPDFVTGILGQIDSVVDSFFLMSAILSTYIMLGTQEKCSVNPFQAIIYRYFRLLPVYAVVVFFSATLMYQAGEGPLWTATIGQEQQYCSDNWRTNLLFINNNVRDDRMCLIHTWYMAADFHFFVVTVFLVLLIYKYPKAGYIVFGVCMAASIIVPYAIIYFNHMDPIQFFYVHQTGLGRPQPFFRYAYSKSHAHATPTFVGIATGLILYRTKSHETKCTWQSTLGLAAGLLVCFCSLVPGSLILSRAWHYTDAVAALVQPLRRLFWPLGVALVIISLVFSKDSSVNKVLSSRIMVFLSKLTYAAYLLSFVLQLITTWPVVTPLKVDEGFLIREGVADICLSFAVAFVLYLTVETPFDNLITKLRQTGRSKHSTFNVNVK